LFTRNRSAALSIGTGPTRRKTRDENPVRTIPLPVGAPFFRFSSSDIHLLTTPTRPHAPEHCLRDNNATERERRNDRPTSPYVLRGLTLRSSNKVSHEVDECQTKTLENTIVLFSLRCTSAETRARETERTDYGVDASRLPTAGGKKTVRARAACTRNVYYVYRVLSGNIRVFGKFLPSRQNVDDAHSPNELLLNN
jgi:hypothetical protein